ncbi:hypothetical protein [Microbacterium kunmingense]|uniref:hypothetical protein n=1 Tax=Microbacterium kunmingense TaxID=2915939 RepID=UPI003D7631B1
MDVPTGEALRFRGAQRALFDLATMYDREYEIAASRQELSAAALSLGTDRRAFRDVHPAEHLHRDPSNVTQIVSRLEEMELVLRARPGRQPWPTRVSDRRRKCDIASVPQPFPVPEAGSRTTREG